MLSWIAEKVTDTAKYIFGIHELELIPDQDSILSPGSLSVISGSLDDLQPPISGERMLAELESTLRWPIDPITEHLLKSCDVTENGPDEFIVKVILDGKKLDSWNRGRGDGCDRVKNWKRVVIDRKALTLMTQDYVPEIGFGDWIDKASDKEVLAEFHLAFHSSPTRFECWLLEGDKRVASKEFAGFLYGWTDGVIKAIKTEMSAKVRVAVGPSPSNPNVSSVVSDAMDEFTDYDTFFDNMVKGCRSFFEAFPDTVIEDVSETEFVANTTVKDDQGKESIMPKRITWNKETGEMAMRFNNAEGQTKHTAYRQLHRSPLRLEAWNVEDSGKRPLPPSLVKQVGQEVNGSL